MTIKLILSILVTFCGSALALQAEESAPIATSICESVGNLEVGDWLILDLDGTVITETQVLGRDQWHEKEVQKMMGDDHRITYNEAVEKLRPLNLAIKHASDVKLTEDCLPDTIDALRDRGVTVFAITGRHESFAAVTIKTLLKFGIDLSKSSLPENLLQKIDWSAIPRPVQYEKGIFFVNGADKGSILEKIIAALPTRPSYVQLYDDVEKNVKAYNRSLRHLELPGVAYHLVESGVVPNDFQMRLAEIQLRDFLARGSVGPILSDDRAAQILVEEACEYELLSSE